MSSQSSRCVLFPLNQAGSSYLMLSASIADSIVPVSFFLCRFAPAYSPRVSWTSNESSHVARCHVPPWLRTHHYCHFLPTVL